MKFCYCVKASPASSHTIYLFSKHPKPLLFPRRSFIASSLWRIISRSNSRSSSCIEKSKNKSARTKKETFWHIQADKWYLVLKRINQNKVITHRPLAHSSLPFGEIAGSISFFPAATWSDKYLVHFWCNSHYAKRFSNVATALNRWLSRPWFKHLIFDTYNFPGIEALIFFNFIAFKQTALFNTQLCAL